MNKSGSSIVFIAIILAALMSISLMLVYAGRNHGVVSFADGVFTLACDSILGRYDYYVQDEYDLFLLKETDARLSDEFSRCASYSLDSISDYSSSSVSSTLYSTADMEPVRQQIIDYMKVGGMVKTFDGVKSDDSFPKRTLRHGPTITGLPSRSLPDKSIIASAETLAESLSGNFRNPGKMFSSSSEKYLFDSYILGKFNNDLYSSHEEHFFRNEVEYVICGELSDDDNCQKTDRAISALRTGLNLTHIYSDPEKVAAVEAASQVITPGVFGTVTCLGIATAWAAAEAENDVLLLHEGHRVPIMKTASSWAIDLDGLINGIAGGMKVINPPVDRGRKYEDYLRILLYTKDENIKTARILDLIQINMRKNHDKNFLVGECATGISVNCRINGQELHYDRIY